MTKVCYYTCKKQDDKEIVLYGLSKTSIIQIGEATKEGPFKSIESVTFEEIKKKHSEKELIEIRAESRKHWEIKNPSGSKISSSDTKKTTEPAKISSPEQKKGINSSAKKSS